jgi:hypothetical protein
MSERPTKLYLSDIGESIKKDVEILWKTVTEDIPALKDQIKRIVSGK